LLYQHKTTGRLIGTRNDAEEIAFIHRTTDWYYAPLVGTGGRKGVGVQGD
jgi:hypothetical protein